MKEKYIGSKSRHLMICGNIQYNLEMEDCSFLEWWSGNNFLIQAIPFFPGMKVECFKWEGSPLAHIWMCVDTGCWNHLGRNRTCGLVGRDVSQRGDWKFQKPISFPVRFLFLSVIIISTFNLSTLAPDPVLCQPDSCYTSHGVWSLVIVVINSK